MFKQNDFRIYKDSLHKPSDLSKEKIASDPADSGTENSASNKINEQKLNPPERSPESGENFDKFIELAQSPKYPDEKGSEHILFKLLILAFALLIFFSFIPYVFFPLNTSPKDVPSFDDPGIKRLLNQIQLNESLIKEQKILDKRVQLYYYESYSDPVLKALADYIVSKSCKEHEFCGPKAIYLFVRDNINYVSDPQKEYFEHPFETLLGKGADCDGKSILLANLLGQIGVKTRFILIKNHIYVEAYLPYFRNYYKADDNWVPLDATCSNCGFGQVPFENYNKEKTIV